ncbi:MAG: 50S ribosomal protein L3 N(5)-glutamine methyltransferase [Porticoccaceae bacterium]|nr:50S ribosomal protein L3 N(5)-glutamine methyltransferase [Porticoccaceae bacterium]
MNDQKDILNTLFTVRDYLRWGCSRMLAADVYFGHGTDNAWDEMVRLLMHVIHMPPEGDPRVLDARLTTAERQAVLQLLEDRIEKRLPLPYLTREAWFCGLSFYVDERVLIPRSPLAELIENGFQPWLSEPPLRILDLCTGSGCIGIACAHAFPEAEVVLSDISVDALAVAEHNIDMHGVGDRVRAVQSDLFESLHGERFDLIITNPPYVDADDLEAMPGEFGHEPELALASGVDGLDFTRRLLAEAAGHLTEQGVVIAEVGNSWVALDAAFPDMPFIWLDFERGGDGVFMLRREQLPEAG